MTGHRSGVRAAIGLVARAGSLAAGTYLVALVAANWRGLLEGIRYLRQLRSWAPTPLRPVDSDGPFGSCYRLAAGDNRARWRLIVEELRASGAAIQELPVPGDPLPSVLARFGGDGPLTLLVAHYDKARETDTYQGACDNTAAVAMLLAAARDLVARPPARPLALLFTSGEERGLLGARAFVGWARAHGVPLDSVINFDMIGRGGLAVRPNAPSGFYLRLPLAGSIAYDGRRLFRSRPYPPPDGALLRRLRIAARGELVVLSRFTAWTDAVAFEEAGIPAVAVSSDDMAYLDRVWERDEDRVELLDETNLELARRLALALSRGEAR